MHWFVGAPATSACACVGVARVAGRVARRTTSVPVRSSALQLTPAHPDGHRRLGPKTPPTSPPGYSPATRLALGSACSVRSLFFNPDDLQFVGAIKQFGGQI